MADRSITPVDMREEIHSAIRELIAEGTVEAQSIAEDGCFCYALSDLAAVKEDVIEIIRLLVSDNIIEAKFVARDGDFSYTLKAGT